MPARWVIHVVGPNWTAGERDRSLLESCYSGALAVADELGARTVAFPLVSAGIYGWPRTTRSAAAVETLRSTPTTVDEARLVAFGRRAYDEIRAVVVALTSRHGAEVVKPSLTILCPRSSHVASTGLR